MLLTARMARTKVALCFNEIDPPNAHVRSCAALGQ